jgi:hypothetical protein
MKIPNFFIRKTDAFNEILAVYNENPNDYDLGKKVRQIIREFEEYKPVNDVELDTKKTKK